MANKACVIKYSTTPKSVSNSADARRKPRWLGRDGGGGDDEGAEDRRRWAQKLFGGLALARSFVLRSPFFGRWTGDFLPNPFSTRATIHHEPPSSKQADSSCVTVTDC